MENAARPRMLDTPADAWYIWVGLAIVATVTLGVASGLPTSPSPDAAAAAGTVDSVAASQYATADEHHLPNADAARIGANSLSLRGPGGEDHARFGYGPVTPVAGGALETVLGGTPPGRVFDTPGAFERALRTARSRTPRWQRIDWLTVRRVSWEGVDAVLVG